MNQSVLIGHSFSYGHIVARSVIYWQWTRLECYTVSVGVSAHGRFLYSFRRVSREFAYHQRYGHPASSHHLAFGAFWRRLSGCFISIKVG